jgi:hypothetical protein
LTVHGPPGDGVRTPFLVVLHNLEELVVDFGPLGKSSLSSVVMSTE